MSVQVFEETVLETFETSDSELKKLQLQLEFKELEMQERLCYLGDRVNASGGCKAAVTARARIGWVKFRESGELLNSKRFSLKMKGMVYRSYMRLAMLYGSETWFLRENEMAILRRTEGAMVRAMCGAKVMEKKRT